MFPHEVDNPVFAYTVEKYERKMKGAFKEEENTVYSQENRKHLFLLKLLYWLINLQGCGMHTIAKGFYIDRLLVHAEWNTEIKHVK